MKEMVLSEESSESVVNMARRKRISLKDWCAKVNRSNGQHKRLRNQARRKAPNGKDVRYHTNVIRIQNVQCRILTRAEKRSIYKRS